MEYINVLAALVLFLLFVFLVGYNILYAARTSRVNKQLGIDLPHAVKTTFYVMMVAAIAAMLISLTIFLRGIFSL